MKELYAGDLTDFFVNTSTIKNVKCTYRKYEKIGEDIFTTEIWEVPDNIFSWMECFDADRFEEICPKGWWRNAEGCVLGYPDREYEINGHKIFAYDGRRREDWKEDCEQYCKVSDCNRTYEDWEQCYLGKERKYSSLLEYLCSEIGVSVERNICAICIDLAKYNNMTMGELFNLCEPKGDEIKDE